MDATETKDLESFEALIARLDEIRRTSGEEAWQNALKDYVIEGSKAGRDPKEFITQFTKFAGERLKAKVEAEAPKPVVEDTEPTPDIPPLPTAEMPPGFELFAQALQAQMPAMKSQAQFNAFMASFEAYRGLVNAILLGSAEKEAEARKTLETSYEVIRKATTITEQLEAVPEAAASRAADDFKKPPAQFTEYDKQRKLLSELEGLRTIEDLQDWYKTTKTRRDEVVSATLRNPLLDAIRAKKLSFGAG